MTMVATKPDLSVTLGPLKLKNPVMTASGTFGFGQEWADFFDLSELGAIMVKAVTVKPRLGNPMPRMVETPAGTLNSIGLQNPGLDAFIAEKMPYLRQFDTAVIVNIAADRMEDYNTLAEALDNVPGVHALEVNISCPNQECGGMEFGRDPVLTRQVIESIRSRTKLPLIAKLSPNVTDITVLARAAADGGADILSLINTFVGTAIDVKKRAFKIANRTGGLSGPCIKPLALYMVWRVAQAVEPAHHRDGRNLEYERRRRVPAGRGVRRRDRNDQLRESTRGHGDHRRDRRLPYFAGRVFGS